ncbi:MAG: glycerophosphoryl diester phosphodiesterase [Myxococcales bacterium]|nr:glycerophosphoryl diester phosphodiesterase [Myxococcales bacterium]
MAAFEAARVAGADGIELDVRLDAGGNVVVFHDHDLQRLAGRPGTMEELSPEDRRALRVGGHPVPLLAEVLDSLGELEVDVEIKATKPGRMGALCAATAQVIKKSGRADQVLVSSFDPFSLIQFHRHLPDIALAFLFHDEQPLPMRKGWVGNWMGASVLHPQNTLVTEASVRAWHTAGLPINVWTVDDAPELERLGRLGVDGVFCNDPAHAIKVLSAVN